MPEHTPGYVAALAAAQMEAATAYVHQLATELTEILTHPQTTDAEESADHG